MPWVEQQFHTIVIEITIFDPIYDFGVMFGIAMLVSILLATFIVLGHKEEV
jgi:cell division transport system permease protein